LCHRKLSFLEEILRQAGIESQIYCDAPEVDLVLQKNDAHTILYLINPPNHNCSIWPGETTSSSHKKETRKLILRFDPKKLGIKGKKLRLIDLLGDEIIKTTPDELKTGIMIEITSPDSRMYLIEEK
jgi:hypothetical protein